jgi:hypothetical protein
MGTEPEEHPIEAANIEPATEEEDYFPTLSYARPPRRVSEPGAAWKVLCKAVGGMMLFIMLAGLVGRALFFSPVRLIVFMAAAGVLAVVLIMHGEMKRRVEAFTGSDAFSLLFDSSSDP